MKKESKFLLPFMLIPDLTASKRIILLFIIGLTVSLKSTQAQQQLVCKDEMLINPYFNCGPFFDPVCACDGETYRNECAAYYHGGIQGSQWVSGPCQEFYFFVYPTLCQSGNLVFWLQSKIRGRVIMYIINNYGRFEYRQQIEVGTSANTQFDIDVSGYEAGIYFIVIQGGSHTQIERFVVLPQ